MEYEPYDNNMQAIRAIARGFVMSPDIETSQVMEWLKTLVDENRSATKEILKNQIKLQNDFTKHKGSVDTRFAVIEQKLKFKHVVIGLLGAALPIIGLIIFEMFKKNII